MNRVVIGVVDNPPQADQTVRRLVAAGFASRDVSVLFPDRHGDHDFGFETTSRAAEGALMGSAFGAILGAMTGLALGIAGAIPQLQLLAEAGPVLAALSSATIGAVILGGVGAAIGLKVPAIEAKYYDGKMELGTILVGVHTRTREDQLKAQAVLTTAAASNVNVTTESALPV